MQQISLPRKRDDYIMHTFFGFSDLVLRPAPIVQKSYKFGEQVSRRLRNMKKIETFTSCVQLLWMILFLTVKIFYAKFYF